MHGPIPLSELAQVALEGANNETVDVVIVPETTGLIGGPVVFGVPAMQRSKQ
jgi:hypothetical protein